MSDAAHREIARRASGKREGEPDRDPGCWRFCEGEQDLRERQRGDRRQRTRRDRGDQTCAARMDGLRREKRTASRKRMNRKPDQQSADQDRGNRKKDQTDDHEREFKPLVRLAIAPKIAVAWPDNERERLSRSCVVHDCKWRKVDFGLGDVAADRAHRAQPLDGFGVEDDALVLIGVIVQGTATPIKHDDFRPEAAGKAT